MKRKYFVLLIVTGLLLLFNACNREVQYKALIITGQNNHNWKASHPILKQLLDQTGIFTTDTLVTPPGKGDMTTFDPDFSKYDVIVLDYNGDSWTEKTKTAFVDYVRNGGGVVVYHAANNSFPEWKEYNEIIGLGGWGNRNEKSGPYVYFRGNEIIRDDTSKGIGGTHGPRSDFLVKMRNLDHPITRGLPVNWMHGNDELYSLLRGPAINMEILATAYSGSRESGRSTTTTTTAPSAVPGSRNAPGTSAARQPRGGTSVSPESRTAPAGPPRPQQSAPAASPGRREGRDEPVLMTISFGKGRIFHTVLGHADNGGGPAMQCAGFIVTFQRGAEWAASGKVSQKVPFDFPTISSVVLRPDFKEITLDEAISGIGSYEIGKSTKYFNFIQNHIQNLAGDEKALLNLEKMIVKVLKSNEATVEAKKLILRELSWMGSDYSVPVIKKLADNVELRDEAEFALERLQSVEKY